MQFKGKEIKNVSRSVNSVQIHPNSDCFDKNMFPSTVYNLVYLIPTCNEFFSKCAHNS